MDTGVPSLTTSKVKFYMGICASEKKVQFIFEVSMYNAIFQLHCEFYTYGGDVQRE